jgi:hypothetical protein
MMIEQFAEKHNLKTSRDECGDIVIRGKRGHLYVDAGVLSAIWTDARPMNRSRLAALGGTRFDRKEWPYGLDHSPYCARIGGLEFRHTLRARHE